MVLKTRIVSQSGSGKKYSFHKIPYIIKAALKLASISAYDDEYRIRNQQGQYLPNTNVHDLLSHCMSVGRRLNAEDEFIDLLAEAKIDPEWILNDNVRAKLIARKKPAQYRQHPSQQPSKPAQYKPHPSQQPSKPAQYKPHPSQRTFTELPPPQQIINFEPGDEDLTDIEEEEPEESNHQLEPSDIVFDEETTGEPEFEVNLDVDKEDERAIRSKNRVRPKILVDRDKLKRKQRMQQNRLQHLDLANIDMDEPRQTRSSKRTRWEFPDDDSGL